MGQHAATLAPAVPAEYVERLAQLQDRAPESTWAEVLEVLNTELPGGTTASLDFDAAPVGSASLAQVHRAERRGTEREGAEVAVKEGFSMAWAIDEFEKTVSTELDFREEAQHADRCRAFFRAHRGSGKLRGGRIVVPGIHHDLTTQRVLVMDFSRGLPIARLTAAVRKCREGGTTELTWEEERAAEAAPEAARLLAEAFGAMCFSEGFLHCDPHPGNLLVELPQATAELLPLYFTNRSMSTYAGLGQPITLEEKDRLKQQLLESGVLPEGGGSALSSPRGEMSELKRQLDTATQQGRRQEQRLRQHRSSLRELLRQLEESAESAGR
eukprot:g16086.t1